MFFTHLLFALFVALLLSAAFVGGLRTKGPWTSLVLFFFVIFLASWAGGVWLHPFGPLLWGHQWLPFLLVGIIFAVLLAAAAPRETSESTVELVDPQERRAERKVTLTSLGVFFWVLIGALIVAVFARYV